MANRELRIEGKVYRLLGTFPLKKNEAKTAAEGWRGKGYKVRIKRRGVRGRDYYLFGRKQ